LLLKMMKAKKAARIMSREKSIRNQSIGRILVLDDYKRKASRISPEGYLARQFPDVYSQLK
jgi:hypothetical protein